MSDGATEEVSKHMQYIVTLGSLGLVLVFFWSKFEPVSRALIMLFGMVALLSIRNGTWMENSRDLRRKQRDDRRQVYGEVKRWVTGNKRGKQS
jgi:hypothetical protein